MGVASLNIYLGFMISSLKALNKQSLNKLDLQQLYSTSVFVYIKAFIKYSKWRNPW